MFQFQPFTPAEIAADPRITMLLEDKRRFIVTLTDIRNHYGPSAAADVAAEELYRQSRIERQREADHYAALQAENVRRGWRPTAMTDILADQDAQRMTQAEQLGRDDGAASVSEQEPNNQQQHDQSADPNARAAVVAAAAPAIPRSSE